MKKYRVLHIFSSKTIGGAEKKTVFLAQSLQKSGLVENIAAFTKGTYMFEQALKNNLETVDFKAGGSLDPVGITKLVRIIKKYKIDIVHVAQGKLYWQALIARLFCPKTKIVFHRRQDTRHGFFGKFHYKFADAVVAISKAVAAGLIKYEKVSPEKIFVVYNGFNFKKFSSNADASNVIKEYGLEGKFVVGTVGAIVDFKAKGQIYLMEAAKNLRKIYSDLRVLIVGTGNGIESQKEYAKALGVDDIVYFTGYRENVADFISAMNVFCLLSWDTEGLGNVLIEAQALSKPVIGTNIGGIPETFIDGKTGILINPSSVSEVEKSVRFFADNPSFAKTFGENGKNFTESEFTVENMVKNIVRVYDKIMTEK